jgi:hypothetical protein
MMAVHVAPALFIMNTAHCSGTPLVLEHAGDKLSIFVLLGFFSFFTNTIPVSMTFINSRHLCIDCPRATAVSKIMEKR